MPLSSKDFDVLHFELYKFLNTNIVQLEYDHYWLWELRNGNVYYVGISRYLWDTYECDQLAKDKNNIILK